MRRARQPGALTAYLGFGFFVASSISAAFYVDATESSKLIFHHRSSQTPRKYLPETMSGGVAILDFDQDGWMDVFFVNGAKLTVPHEDGQEPDKSAPEFWNRLFRNNADGTFTDVTEAYGVQGRGYGMGVAVGDYDGDGYPDLFVTNHGTGTHPSSTLYRNESGKAFVDVTERSGIHTQGWTSSAGFVDYDHDGDLDLFVCRFVQWSFEEDRRCGVGTPSGRAYCHPRIFEPISNYLFRNNGDGTFADVSRASGIQQARGKGLGVGFADFNRDGWIDISVANDSVPQFLFKNEGDGTFTELAMPAGAALDDDGRDFGGMGTEFSDLDGDGLPDIVTTTFSHQRYAYFHNTGDELFEYRTAPSALGGITYPYTGWGMRLFDFDNDGRKDAFFANGHLNDKIEIVEPRIRFQQPPLLLRFRDGRFTDVSRHAGSIFQRRWVSRGAAVGDFDNDGYLDLVVSNCNGLAYFARNEARERFRNNWIALRLIGRRSNPEGIGARIVITGPNGETQNATVSRAASYLSSQDPRVFFGLGKQTAVRSIKIYWPRGIEQTVSVDKVNQILTVKESWGKQAKRREW